MPFGTPVGEGGKDRSHPDFRLVGNESLDTRGSVARRSDGSLEQARGHRQRLKGNLTVTLVGLVKRRASVTWVVWCACVWPLASRRPSHGEEEEARPPVPVNRPATQGQIGELDVVFYRQ